MTEPRLAVTRGELLPKLRRYADTEPGFGSRGYAGLDFRCRQLFTHAGSLAGKRVLEIGGGEGLFLLWALANGARQAANVEPVAAGSFSDARDRFHHHRDALGLDEDTMRFYPVPLQEFSGDGEPWDIILSYSSINHLDEEACEQLGTSAAAQSTYQGLFRQLAGLLAQGGRLIIQDAGRVNYWNLLGLQSPFCPSIEWHKHQEPETWAALARSVGLSPVGQEWLRLYKLRHLGPIGRSRLAARATLSQFVLVLGKVDV